MISICAVLHAKRIYAFVELFFKVDSYCLACHGHARPGLCSHMVDLHVEQAM